MIIDTLLKNTTHKVYVCSLPNVKDVGLVRDIYTRDRAKIEAFIKKEDAPGRGVFYCVSTVDGPRNIANARETAFIHADVDFKHVPDVAGLKNLSLPPSWIVMSGHGMHLYWALEEPTTEDVTDIIKHVCRIVCGDAAVTHRAALMRMPGTHNSKEEPVVEVTCSRDSGRRFTLEQLREWKQAPVLKRNSAVDIPDELAAYAALGAEYKPRVDVHARLAAMTYQGAGDAGVHQTQLHVTAALMSRGENIDDVVSRVLIATQAAVGDSVAWNWSAEERNIRNMCQSFVTKKLSGAQSASDNVVSFTDAKEKKAKKAKDDEEEKTPLHIALTEAFWKALAAQGQRLLLVGQRLWHYKGGVWREIDDDKAWINRTLDRGCTVAKVSPTIRLIAEARENIMRKVDHVANREWDVHGLIATQSGLVDLETGEVRPAEPDDYVTHRIECEFDPDAKCPNWMRVLKDVTQGMDPKTIDVLQEVAGMTLVENKPKALRKAFVAVGPSNSGKSNVITVMSGLCADGIITTGLDAISGTHGLSEFTQRRPWVVHEAFNVAKWHISSDVKAIISGEPININQKNKAPITTRYRMPVFWGGNTAPKFKEETKAVANRMIIMQFLHVFEKLSGVALDAIRVGYETPADFILATEKAGLLNWAMVGARRALARGHFEETTAMTAAVDAMHQNAVLVGSFVADCIERDVEGGYITHPDFCGAFASYFAESRGSGQHCPGNDTIGRSVVESGLLADAKMHSNSGSKYEGIHLNELGLKYWQTCRSAATSSLINRQTRMAKEVSEVNKVRLRKRG